VSYDTFTKTSLLGRPWLIPQKFAEGGLNGMLSLFAESHILTTLFRVFGGFFFGAVPGIVVGVIMGMNRTVRLMLDATMSAIYVLPKIAIFPIMMLVFSNPFGEGPKIAVVAIASFFLVAINTMAGVRDIDPVYLESGKNYGANRWQMFWHVITPGAMPVIFAGLRLALGTAIIATVAIEFVRAKKGAGFLILYYWEIMVPEKMYAALVVIMVLGVLLSYGLHRIEKQIMPWRREEQKTSEKTFGS
jgi:ABC-type nitrate/sulfonate/bicarbonate transport system permease component